MWGWTRPTDFFLWSGQKLHPTLDLWQHKPSLTPGKNVRESSWEKAPGKFSSARARLQVSRHRSPRLPRYSMRSCLLLTTFLPIKANTPAVTSAANITNKQAKNCRGRRESCVNTPCTVLLYVDNHSVPHPCPGLNSPRSNYEQAAKRACNTGLESDFS